MPEITNIKNRYNIIGDNARLNLAIETALAVAPTNISILICGESGVGKEVLPRIIHDHSRRRTERFLTINCGAIPPGTINSELFGHEKGAFTGAVGERKGYFEDADRGTLVLDEIGELPKDTQALLLRVLQNGEFIRVGSSKVQKTDVRIIASTNVDLEEAVQKGTFRADLYYRLRGVSIMMPSLRERKEDICTLFRKFSYDFAEENRLCKFTLTEDAELCLKNYRWPGNIRELKNIAESVTAIKSEPIAPGRERIKLSENMLKGLIPDNYLPVIVPSPRSEGAASEISDERLTKILSGFGSTFDALNERIKQLTERIERLESGGGAREALPIASQEDVDDQTNEPSTTPSRRNLTLKEITSSAIEDALERNNGNIKLAAQELDISERTIYRHKENS